MLLFLQSYYDKYETYLLIFTFCCNKHFSKNKIASADTFQCCNILLSLVNVGQ